MHLLQYYNHVLNSRCAMEYRDSETCTHGNNLSSHMQKRCRDQKELSHGWGPASTKVDGEMIKASHILHTL